MISLRCASASRNACATEASDETRALPQSAPGARPRARRLPEPPGRRDRALLRRGRSRSRGTGRAPERSEGPHAGRQVLDGGAVQARDEAARRVTRIQSKDRPMTAVTNQAIGKLLAKGVRN